MATRPTTLAAAASNGRSSTGGAQLGRAPDDLETRIVVSLLDGFDLSYDGRSVPLPLTSQRLVAFLALHDRPMLRLFVAGSLWLDLNEERSCANLRSTLWRLRQPGHQVVETTATHVRLGRQVIVDVHELVRAARRIVDGTDVTDTRNDERKLEGDLLPDWYDAWVEPERERLRQLRLHAIEAAAERALAEDRPAHAIDLALGGLRGEPLRESLHVLVIRGHLARGNRSDAIRHHRNHVARMATDLGLSPSPDIARLLEEADAIHAG
jgi:DNA-binding SARP family transcriptional activator